MPLPETMTVVEITEPGGPEVLKPATRPVPQPAHDEVLIKVAAAGVNRPDIAQRKGGYPPPKGAPEWPGLEVAGEVVAAGAGVDRWKAGDKVMALVAGGGYAEYVTAPAAQTLPIPAGMDMVSAAGVPETYFTVWTNVFDRGRLQAGETFLVHGGSSGIGTTAIQLAAARGARVFATAGTDEKCRACEKLGAEKAINYRTQDFVAEAKTLTDGRGVDLILDMVGGPYIQKNIDTLALEGRLVQIAFLQGSKAEVDFVKMMVKRLTITGSTLRPRTVEQKAEIAEALEREVWPLLESGRVGPVIDKTFSFPQGAEAHAYLEASGHVGKVILTMD
ncbi:NAD(P)H-quinone oxidoreductase [Futiania mangrovi]|uniref:NAD(P)H-quinone oxidoreductase n=1 Tax=Futiania mangrovi TaxID=2959716 RepID=A0A9J6PFI2_9PROT|nr:NAD(P)H-quinone oxidoreductase [Futiania mangrovii]MCP1334866.1 NAD(P)H-quinone oxidoreductase [Futiania mangrovii]